MMVTGHVFIATSLDGFIARPDGSIDWLLALDGQGEDHGYEDFIRDMDVIIMGRNTFATMCNYRPWPYTRPVLVLSRGPSLGLVPDYLSGQVEPCDTDPAAVMMMLGQRGCRRAYVDGGLVIQSFLQLGLIQDMVVTRVPVLLGEGRSLFGPLAGDVSLTHVSTRCFPSGLVQSTYKVAA
ncbi:dihydrofolate reductase family protein [Niveispirillum lacus]|nr:dihydrofolate reductase family protein [Niveispirillum lacus]